ncbi:MAG TPA: hypothetical protein VGE75_02525, partial [Acidimicrobiales bacterium]
WTQGNVFTIVGQYDADATLSDGASAASSQMVQPDYATFDGVGNLILDDYAGGVAVLAMTASNPGYVLGDDCGSGSVPCVWSKGDVFTLAGENFHESRGIAVDASDNVVIAESDSDLLLVLAESSTNPGYTLTSDCGAGSAACTWTPGDVFVISLNPGNTGPTASGSPAIDTAVGYASGTVFDGLGNLLLANNRYQVIDMLAMSDCSTDCPYGLDSYTQGDIYVIAGGGSSFTATTHPNPAGDNGPPTSAFLGSGTANYLALDNVNDAVVVAESSLNMVRTFDGGNIAPTTTTYFALPTFLVTTTTSTTTTSTTTSTTTTTVPTTTTTTTRPRPLLRESFYFALDVTSLDLKQESLLAKLARTVKNDRFPDLGVVGFSDPLSTGAAASALGLARAQAVGSYLHRQLVLIGDGAVTIGTRAGGVLRATPYSRDRVAVLSS